MVEIDGLLRGPWHRRAVRPARVCLAAVLFVLVVPVASADADFQQDLDRAKALNVSASVAETRVVLDLLAARLDQATPEQRAEYQLLHARNLVLAGQSDEGARVLDDLLAQPPTTALAIRAYGLAANIAMIARQWERAFEQMARGLALEPDMNDPDGMVGLLIIAAYVHAQAGQPQRAIDYAKRSLEFAELTGSPRNLCLALHRIGYAQKRAREDLPAEDHYRRAVGKCAEAGDLIIGAVAKSGLADLLRQDGQLDAAEALFNEAIENLTRSGYEVGLVEARFFRSRLLFAQGRYDEVEAILTRIDPQLESNGQLDYLAEAFEMLATVARMRGRDDQVAEWLTRAMATRARHLDSERAIHLAFLGVEFDLQLKEQELALLREQSRVAGLEKEAQRQQLRLRLLVGVAATLVAVMLALLLFQARRERRRLLGLSRRDGLTGLENHSWFFAGLRRSLESLEGGSTLVLALADIDHFKLVNDRHGHPAGDEVLKRVAGILAESIGARGHLGRVGGEEFGISFPGMSMSEAVVTLQQLRRQLEEARPGPAGAPLTMSFGLAMARAGEAVESLRMRADGALYRAKQEGRDRLIVADGALPEAPVT